MMCAHLWPHFSDTCADCVRWLADHHVVLHVPPARLAPLPTVGQVEKALQGRLSTYAKTYGYKCYHTYDSRKSGLGFPDTVLVRPPVLATPQQAGRPGRHIIAELKASADAYPDREQQRWLEVFWVTTHAECYVWSVEDEAAMVAVLEAPTGPAPRSTQWMNRCHFPFPSDWAALASLV